MNPSLAPTPLDVFNCPLDGISLIEASAGTGKTWNICGLYLRMLLEQDLDIQKILVVTFTNAATAELRERIRARPFVWEIFSGPRQRFLSLMLPCESS